jgi:hypothetical protein
MTLHQINSVYLMMLRDKYQCVAAKDFDEEIPILIFNFRGMYISIHLWPNIRNITNDAHSNRY